MFDDDAADEPGDFELNSDEGEDLGDEGAEGAPDPFEEGEGEGEGEGDIGDEAEEEAGPEGEGPGGAPPGLAHPEAPRPDRGLRESNQPRAILVVPDEKRVTDSRLHATEAARLIALRATQIDRDGTCFIPHAGRHDPVILARDELYAGRCPLLVRRNVGISAAGERYVEDWDPRTMALPPISNLFR